MKRNLCAGLILAGFAILNLSQHTDAATQYPGYTLCAAGSEAYLLDANGTEVHSWTAAGSVMACAYLLTDGSVLFPSENCQSGQHDGMYMSGRFQKIGWDGDILWDYTYCSADATPGYDVEPMPNGNVLIPCESSSGPGKIIELKPTGTKTAEVVWSFTLPTSLESNGTYINSVSYNPQLDQIVIDLQTPLKTLVVIDHSTSTGSVLYTYSSSSDFSTRVHAAAWSHKYYLGTDIEIPDADTTAMRINNILAVSNGNKAAIEVNPTTKTKVKSISYAYGTNEGSIQRLPNGNNLMTPGNSSSIAEYADGSTTAIKTFKAPVNGVERAFRYGTAFPGLSRLTGTKANIAATQKTTAVSPITYSNGTISYNNLSSSSVELRVFALNGKPVKSVRSSDRTIQVSTNELLAGSYVV